MGRSECLLLAVSFVSLCTLQVTVGQATCNFIDSCTCDMSDGSGRVNLKSLAGPGLDWADAAFSATDGYWTSIYNPCNGFSYLPYQDMALAQHDHNGAVVYDLGVQSSAQFSYSGSSGLTIHYTSTDTLRSSRVLLVCQSGMNSNTFEYIGELNPLEYEFFLTSPCACPGLCDDDGPTIPLPTPPPSTGGDKTCNFIDSCTCEMSDGSGRVNLHGPALEYDKLDDAGFEAVEDGWRYKYNPCNGFSLGGYYDLAIFQSQDYYGASGFDLGVQAKAKFNYAEDSGLAIHYEASDSARTSRVLLICGAGATEHKLHYVGELVETEYDFIFTSPCACPGACDNNGIITGGPATASPSTGDDTCNYVDSCTCDMSDGSGKVNLHSLALQGNPLYDAGLSVTADGWLFKYNPCVGFSYLSYSNLAIAQIDEIASWGYDLGVQGSASFNYSQSNGLSIHYKSADGVRSSRVLLICQSELNSNVLEYVGELTILEYDFILTSPCACPGMCNDDGPVVTLPTPPPTGSDVTCNFIDSCTCEMSDGTGQVNLHGPALEGAFLREAAFSTLGYDFWWYLYNPCNGFTTGGFVDLAIFQSSDAYGSSGFDLGVQSTATFNYTQSSGLSIHYKAADSLRTSRVLLVCASGSDQHVHEFIGELVTTEYDFVFTSPCACPGACDDDGVIKEPTPPPGSDACKFVDSCTCEMLDGSGEVNLHSLGLDGASLSDASFSVYGSGGWKYNYNPCNGFSMFQYSNLALSQTDSLETYGFDLGVQSSAYFYYDTTNGLSIEYKSADGVRTSRILLVCQSEVDQDVFEFVGELTTLQYEFILSSPCACPGKCNDNGPIVPLPTSPSGGTGDKTCSFIDSCTCDMSDGSGEINLHALSLDDPYGYLYDSAFTVVGSDGWYYKYNPCNGFYFSYYYDVAVAQSSDTYGYGYGNDLGVQSSAQFIYAESSGLTIKYTSSDQVRSSRVLLLCEPNTNDHKFEYIGELTTLEYDFLLTTPCACPGGCDEDGVIQSPPSGTYCSKVDSCACEMTDGTGRINLRSLGLKGDTLTEAAFTADGLDGWLYKYNPCNDFSYLYYYDLALAQVNFHGTSGHDLGSQTSTDFQYSENNGLTIHYDSGDKLRESRVLLVCDPYAMEAEFQYIGELSTLEYDFLLKSVCACPGGCTDFGVTNPVVTQPPNGENGGNPPDNINVNVNQAGSSDSSDFSWPYVGSTTIALIFHDLLLIIVIAAIVVIVKKTAWGQQETAQARFAQMSGTVAGQSNA